MVTPRGKIPSTGGSEEGRTRDAASRRTASPTHYRLSYTGPKYQQTRTVSYLEMNGSGFKCFNSILKSTQEKQKRVKDWSMYVGRGGGELRLVDVCRKGWWRAKIG